MMQSLASLFIQTTNVYQDGDERQCRGVQRIYSQTWRQGTILTDDWSPYESNPNGCKVDFIYRKQNSNKNHMLFEQFDNTRDKINIARTGDHGDHLIEEAREHMKGVVYTKSIGKNPATNEDWRTVDWAETARRGRANGDNVAANIRDFRRAFYGPGSAALHHLQVIRSYKYTNDRAVSCGRRGMQRV